MKKLTSYVMTIFFALIALAIAGPGEDAIIANEKAAWQAFKDKKADDFKKIVGNDIVAVYADGVMNMQNEIDTMNKTTMKSFALSDIKVSMPDTETAVIAYKCKVDRTFEGKEDNGTYNCGSVWRKQGSDWKAVFHCDMKEEAAAK